MKRNQKEQSAHKPPCLANALLEVFFNTYEVEEIQGDLYEMFERRVHEYGLEQARRRYWVDVLRFLNPIHRKRKIMATYPSPPRLAMLHNYLLTAIRGAKKNRLTAAINLVGLSTGIAAFLLIVQFVLFEKSYDRFHQRSEDIYRVPFSWEPLSRGNTDEIYASNVPAFGPALLADFPEVEQYTRLLHVHVLSPTCVLTRSSQAGKRISFHEAGGYYADDRFLTLFSFPLLTGNRKTALRNPNSIVLTRSAASKYFGQEDPIGKTLELTNESPSGSYTVTGILADVPRNSHLQFDFLLSYASLGAGSVQKSWVWSQFYTYIRLRPGSDAKALEAKLPAFLKKYNGETCQYEVFLQPLAAIHLTSHYRYEASVNSSERTVNFLLIMAGLILLIAWSNYLNLTSAKAMEKSREIGVRKAVGATRLSLLGQFLVQAFLTNGVALLIALVLIGLSLPLFITKITEGAIAFSLFGKGSFWGLSALVFTIGSLVSGAYPALLLSSFGPVEALKGKVKVGSTGLLLRKGLVVGQFAVCITLAIFTLLVVAQYRFMQQQDLGLQVAQTLVLKAPTATNAPFKNQMEYFRQQITKSTAVSEVTFSSSIPGKEITTTRGLKRLNGEPKGDSNFFLVGVDEQFLDFYQIPLVAGRRFAKVHQATDQGQSVILNEQALEVLQLKDPAQAIGEQVQLNGKGRKLTIVGVIKNFHNKSLDQPQEPLVLYLDSLHEGYLSLRLQPKLLQASLHQVEQVYSQAFPNQPLEYFFLDDFFNQQYHQEARNLTVFTSFATLSILIACLGLVGLTAHTLTAKTKEIGLRKVLGGTTAQVAGLLVKEVLKTVLLASLVALPLGFVVSTNWLSHYAFRLPLDWLYFLLPPLGVTIIALLSTGYQTFQAARTPPTRFLKQQ